MKFKKVSAKGQLISVYFAGSDRDDVVLQPEMRTPENEVTTGKRTGRKRRTIME
jgi:hypothetical protein